jgi:regulator of replication initiation timing
VATVVAAEVVRREVEKQQSQRHHDLERKVADLTEKLAAVGNEREKAIEAANRLRVEVQPLREELQRQREQHEHVRQLLSQQEQQLRDKTHDAKNYRDEWNIAERTIVKLRVERDALRAATLSVKECEGRRAEDRRFDLDRERTEALAEQVQTLTRQLAESRRQCTALEASSQREEEFRLEVANLKRELTGAQAMHAHLHDKLARQRKKNVESLEEGDKAKQPRGLLRRAAEAVGLIGVGAAAGFQAQKLIESGRTPKTLSSPAPPRRLRGKTQD